MEEVLGALEELKLPEEQVAQKRVAETSEQGEGLKLETWEQGEELKWQV